MADKPKTCGLDYGHRTYMDADDYTSAMARGSDKAIDNRFKRPHSDDKKPYYNDEYPEMEYFWTPYDPPNFVPPGIPDDPRIVLPPSYPGYNPGGGPTGQGDFTGCVFTVPQGDKFLNYEDITYSGIGLVLTSGRDVGRPDEFYVVADPLVSLAVEFGPIKILTEVATVNRLAVGFTTPRVLVQALTEQEIEDGDYQLDGDYYPSQIVATTKSGGQCWFAVWVVKCPPSVEFEWDTENSPETITQDHTISIFVEGGVPPFQWEVSGTGYTLGANKTTGRGNTLSSSGSSCGSATITVTDYCDAEVVATIRNTTRGTWVWKGSYCGLVAPVITWTGGRSTPYDMLWTTVYLGGQRQWHMIYITFIGERYYDTESECEADRFNYCGRGYPSPCLQPPSHWVYGSYPNSGIFDLCPDGGAYVEECHKEYYWTSRPGYLRESPVQLSYYEWECP